MTLLKDSLLPVGQDSYLGPATVTEIRGRRARLETPDALPWAELALAHCYQPVVGDTVLAIGRESTWYVIGILQGTGTSTLTAPGDLEFRAPRGRIRFQAAEGVRLSAPLIELVGATVEVTAKSLVQTASDVVTWARRALRIRAERLNTDVEKTAHLKAGEIIEQAEGDARIQAKTIHLS